jgi:dynein heavy chain
LAEELMRIATEQGKWVFFQNCHLAPSWMPSLEGLVEQLDPKKVSTRLASLKIQIILRSTF